MAGVTAKEKASLESLGAVGSRLLGPRVHTTGPHVFCPWVRGLWVNASFRWAVCRTPSLLHGNTQNRMLLFLPASLHVRRSSPPSAGDAR